MKRKPKQYLEHSKWPSADKHLWEVAFAPGRDVFDAAGPGSRLADRTLTQLEYTYGKFYFFLRLNMLNCSTSLPPIGPTPRRSKNS
jgi:hypothetical protein